ncbi:hypothetical protein EVAR_64976_1, partial [Eumeta japonica]
MGLVLILATGTTIKKPSRGIGRVFFLFYSRTTMEVFRRDMVDGLEEHDIYCCVDIFSSDLENLWRGHANFSTGRTNIRSWSP